MSKGKILVVDDDRLVLATLSYGLQQAGFEVFDADNGDDAILLAREHRPQLALLDIRMEGLSGFDVAAYLRDYLGTPFMFLSAFADDETLARVKELGAIAYLVKPLDLPQILPAVEAAFARATLQASPAPRRTGTGTGTGTGTDDLDIVALAVGVLMHRYSLERHTAQDRLARLAESEGRTLTEQASRLVGALEELAKPA